MENDKSLFLIRKQALKKNVIEEIASMIENEGYKIIDATLIEIKSDKKKFYKNFYKNFDKFENSILESNGNKCLVIIAKEPEGGIGSAQRENLKKDIRRRFAKNFPFTLGVPGNIIHFSDMNDFEQELSLLLDEKKLNFKGVGTLWKEHDSFSTDPNEILGGKQVGLQHIYIK